MWGIAKGCFLRVQLTLGDYEFYLEQPRTGKDRPSVSTEYINGVVLIQIIYSFNYGKAYGARIAYPIKRPQLSENLEAQIDKLEDGAQLAYRPTRLTAQREQSFALYRAS